MKWKILLKIVDTIIMKKLHIVFESSKHLIYIKRVRWNLFKKRLFCHLKISSTVCTKTTIDCRRQVQKRCTVFTPHNPKTMACFLCNDLEKYCRKIEIRFVPFHFLLLQSFKSFLMFDLFNLLSFWPPSLKSLYECIYRDEWKSMIHRN